MKTATIWRMAGGLVLGLALSAGAADWYVATSGNDDATGSSWAEAKATIQAGVDAAAAGDTVWVSNGVYDTGGGRAGIGTWPNRVTIDKAITVRSVNGAEATRIVGSGMRCAYVAEGATLMGFMLTNGVTSTEFIDPYQTPLANRVGGGAYVQGTLVRCIVTGNRAGFLGGGVYRGIINQCLLVGNRIGDGNIGDGAFESTLNNCTVVGHPGTAVAYSSIDNCIVYSNGTNYFGCGFSHSCTTPDPGGTGNITDDPQFVDETAGNYRLLASSFCVGMGVNTNVNETMDLDGNPRIVYGKLDMGAYEVQTQDLFAAPARTFLQSPTASENRIDVWACVAWTAAPNVPWLSIAAGGSGTTNGVVEINVATNPVVGGSRTGAVVVAGGGFSRTCMVIQVGSMAVLAVSPAIIQLPSAAANGQRINVTANMPWTAVTNVPWMEITSRAFGTTNGRVTFAVAENLLQTGSRTGMVVVTGGGVARTCTVVQARAQTCSWYVATNGNDEADGTTWATAKATIQAAVDAALESDTVWVSNGVYATGGGRAGIGTWPNRVTIDKAIIVRSVHGAEATQIVGDGMRCVFVTNGATLIGFTLTNGVTTSRMPDPFYEMNGGGALCLGDGMLVRCIVTGNSAKFAGGGVMGGILNHCILSGNSAWFGGGAYASTLNNCLLFSNAPDWVNSGTLNHCTVVGHISISEASIFCTVNNSIVYSNGRNFDETCTFTSSCTTPDPGGTGNITNDPQFVDAAAGDYRLQASSPCIDAGDNGFVGWNEDMDGNPRIAYGLADMGAYEAQLMGAGTWFGAITNGLTNDLDCAAGDQTPNLMKYAMGGSPRQPQDRMFVGGMFTNGSGPKLTFSRNRNATDVRFIVESAESMTNGALWRGVATNVDGSWGGATNVVESGTGNPVECTVTAPEAGTTNCFLRLRVLRLFWDTGYADLGGGWRRLDWFGDYIPTGAGGWIWHNRLGTLRVTAASTPDDIWMYADGLGWLWTSRTQFPNLFRKSDEAWLWYNGSTNPRWFMNFSTGQWERWP